MTRLSIALPFLLLLAYSASAHDYWLVPETFTPKPGASVPVRLYVGEAFKPEQEVAYSAKKTAALQLVTATKTVTDFPDLKDGANRRSPSRCLGRAPPCSASIATGRASR